MSNRYHNLSTAELYARLDDFLTDDEIAIREASRVIMALRANGERPDVAKAGPLKWWKEIYEERLHPRAAIVLNSFPKAIAAVMQLEKSMQEAVANGRSLDVAVINRDGEVSHKTLRILQIPAKTLAVLASAGSVRPVAAQGADLLAAFQSKPSAEVKTIAVKANAETKTVTVGSSEVPAIRLIEALQGLGFIITKKED